MCALFDYWMTSLTVPDYVPSPAEDCEQLNLAFAGSSFHPHCCFCLDNRIGRKFILSFFLFCFSSYLIWMIISHLMEVHCCCFFLIFLTNGFDGCSLLFCVFLIFNSEFWMIGSNRSKFIDFFVVLCFLMLNFNYQWMFIVFFFPHLYIHLYFGWSDRWNFTALADLDQHLKVLRLSIYLASDLTFVQDGERTKIWS